MLIKVLILKNSQFPLIPCQVYLIPWLIWLNDWNKELLTLRNFFVVTKNFLKAKFDCTSKLN